MTQAFDPVPHVTVAWSDIVSGSGSDTYIEVSNWDRPVQYFVGRNGTGKSRAARAIAGRVPLSRYLSTDRLAGIMGFTTYQWGAEPQEFQGLALDGQSQQQAMNRSNASGAASRELYALRERPDVWLRVVALPPPCSV